MKQSHLEAHMKLERGTTVGSWIREDNGPQRVNQWDNEQRETDKLKTKWYGEGRREWKKWKRSKKNEGRKVRGAAEVEIKKERLVACSKFCFDYFQPPA